MKDKPLWTRQQLADGLKALSAFREPPKPIPPYKGQRILRRVMQHIRQRGRHTPNVYHLWTGYYHLDSELLETYKVLKNTYNSLR